MVASYSPDSPLDIAAETVDERITEAFKILGNDIRLAILLVLWEGKQPGPPLAELTDPPISFAELSERVGVLDTGQFTYHLNRLVGTFVASTDEGYSLTPPAQRILSTIFSGTLIDHSSITDEPINGECLNCGGQRVMDYSDGILVERCTSCAGVWQVPNRPSGVNVVLYRPPIGMLNRSPEEFQRHGMVWDRYREFVTMEGICPDCSGTVSTTIHVCEDHDRREGTICDDCGTMFEILALFVCDVCKYAYVSPAYRVIFTETAVIAFFHEHGIDLYDLEDEFPWLTVHHAVTDVAVTRTTPLEIEVTVELDGDSLYVTLDDEAEVIDTTDSGR